MDLLILTASNPARLSLMVPRVSEYGCLVATIAFTATAQLTPHTQCYQLSRGGIKLFYFIREDLLVISIILGKQRVIPGLAKVRWTFLISELCKDASGIINYKEER